MARRNLTVFAISTLGGSTCFQRTNTSMVWGEGCILQLDPKLSGFAVFPLTATGSEGDTHG